MKFRKKPVVIDAMQFDGQNGPAIMRWVGPACRVGHNQPVGLVIDTLEGPMTVSPGDWVIRGVKGEFYSCRDDIFEATYEPA